MEDHRATTRPHLGHTDIKGHPGAGGLTEGAFTLVVRVSLPTDTQGPHTEAPTEDLTHHPHTDHTRAGPRVPQATRGDHQGDQGALAVTRAALTMVLAVLGPSINSPCPKI